MEISINIKKQLFSLARTYETPEFYKNDPSMILHQYESSCDTEIAAFIMALLSFGRRDLFLKKAKIIFDMAGDNPSVWIKSGRWKKDFPCGPQKFYRFYSFDDMREVFAVLQNILMGCTSFGDYVRARWEESFGGSKYPETNKDAVISMCGKLTAITRKSDIHLCSVISSIFGNCRAVPHTECSANKRINMFLRWMVRVGSPVDAGLWMWFSPRDLIIPLDTHVLQEAIKLGLIPANSKGTMKTALAITDSLRQIWPDDPCRGDFALFGLGILP